MKGGMHDHPQYAEDIDLYALGVLEGEEKQALESHLTACDDCQRKLRMRAAWRPW